VYTKIKIFFGIDKAVALSLIKGLWIGFSSFITLYFVAKYLDPISQGYYFTFYSIIALQLFVEMGLTFSLVQFVSHEMAHLSMDSKGNLSGNLLIKRRLQTIIIFAYKWFGLGALLFFVILIPCGAIFFNDKLFFQGSSDVLIPWIILVAVTAINLILTASMSIIEGTGKISEVIIMKFLQSLFSSIAMWFFLINNLGLYALAFSSLIGLITGLIWLFIRFRNFFLGIFRYKSKEPGINWRCEIFPFQWRIALSWMSGYFIFYSLTPLLFKQSGAEVAGQFGASMQIFSVLNGGAIVWISTKMPIFGMLAAKKNYQSLKALFFKSFFQSTAILVIAILIAILFYWYLVSINAAIVNKILPFYALILLAISSLLNHAVFSMASYLRSFKKEPFMMVSILNALCTFLLALLLVPYYSYMGAVFSYFIGTLLFGFIFGGLIFIKNQAVRTND
jgi:O-antigen/teichoic acid export membrane protein